VFAKVQWAGCGSQFRGNLLAASGVFLFGGKRAPTDALPGNTPRLGIPTELRSQVHGFEEKVTAIMDTGTKRLFGIKRSFLLVAVVVVAAIGIAAFIFLSQKAAAHTYFTEPVQRGPIASSSRSRPDSSCACRGA